MLSFSLSIIILFDRNAFGYNKVIVNMETRLNPLETGVVTVSTQTIVWDPFTLKGNHRTYLQEFLKKCLQT